MLIGAFIPDSAELYSHLVETSLGRGYLVTLSCQDKLAMDGEIKWSIKIYVQLKDPKVMTE